MSGKDPSTSAVFHCLPICIIRSRTPGTQTNTHKRCQHYRQHLNLLCHYVSPLVNFWKPPICTEFKNFFSTKWTSVNIFHTNFWSNLKFYIQNSQTGDMLIAFYNLEIDCMCSTLGPFTYELVGILIYLNLLCLSFLIHQQIIMKRAFILGVFSEN